MAAGILALHTAGGIHATGAIRSGSTRLGRADLIRRVGTTSNTSNVLRTLDVLLAVVHLYFNGL